MNNMGKILVVDDNKDLLIAAKILLKQQFSIVHTEQNPENITQLLMNENYDVIMLDMNFSKDATSGNEGFFWLKKVLELDPNAIVIMITAFGDIELAVKAVKEGAFDFILKPWQNEKLLATISAAVKLRSSRTENLQLKSFQMQISIDSDSKLNDFIGESPAMMEVFNKIQKVAKTDANVLILGENGTGKELAARAIHHNSDRADQLFVSVDLGAITESLFESELFGYAKGAFTDAKEVRAGRFEISNNGTLFLDEIGNLPPVLQAKLLTAIEQKKIARVGSNKYLPINNRIICATNMPIYEMVKRNEFRQDLLYRINTVEIQLPPLRERLEDIPVLSKHFLNIFAHKYRKQKITLSPSALKKLQSYHWPGNIRELQHTIERSLIMCDSNILNAQDFLLSRQDTKSQEVLSLEQLNLGNIEKMVIQKALTKNEGNISKTANELGLTRTSLYRRMGKFNL